MSLAAAEDFLEGSDSQRRAPLLGSSQQSPTRSVIDLTGLWQVAREYGQRESVHVPSASLFSGKMTFVRTFDVPDSLLGSSHFQLLADGISDRCEIWINNSYIGQHTGGYTGFSLPVNVSALRAGGGNTIKIAVDNSLDARRSLPPEQQVFGWKSYGGIIRGISILATPQTWVDDVVVDPVFDLQSRRCNVRFMITVGTASRELASSLVRRGKSFLLAVEIAQTVPEAFTARSAPVAVDLSGRGVETVSLQIPNPALWSPSSPRLYEARILLLSRERRAVIDEKRVSFGIRSLTADRGRLYLNGEPILIKGVTWVEDFPGSGGAVSEECIERDLAMIKALGANAIRAAFHPPHPYLVDLCDRYGILLFEEMPAWNVPDGMYAAPGFRESAKKYLREMTSRDRNHPSVAAWGLMSWFDSSSPEAAEVLAELTRDLRAGGDRHLTYMVTPLVRNDVCGEAVDLPMLDLQGADVDGLKEAALIWTSRYPSKPFLVGAFGDIVEHGNHRGYSDPRSEEAQANRFVQYYAVVRELNLSGGFLASFADWHGDVPTTLQPYRGGVMYNLGMLSYQRQERSAYAVVRAMYTGERIPALVMGWSSEQTPMAFIIVGLLALIITVYAMNQNRRFRENVSRSLFRSYNFFADLRDERVISLLQTLFLAGLLSLTASLTAGSLLYHFRFDPVADRLLSIILVSPVLKGELINLTWTPTAFLLYGTVIAFLLAMLLTGALWLALLIGKVRISILQALHVAVWAAAPGLLALVVGMILVRLMEMPAYVIPLLLIIGFIAAWNVLRLLKGLSVVSDIRPRRVYGIAFLFFIVIIGGAGLFFNYEFSTFGYLRLLLQFARGSIAG